MWENSHQFDAVKNNCGQVDAALNNRPLVIVRCQKGWEGWSPHSQGGGTPPFNPSTHEMPGEGGKAGHYIPRVVGGAPSSHSYWGTATLNPWDARRGWEGWSAHSQGGGTATLITFPGWGTAILNPWDARKGWEGWSAHSQGGGTSSHRQPCQPVWGQHRHLVGLHLISYSLYTDTGMSVNYANLITDSNYILIL